MIVELLTDELLAVTDAYKQRDAIANLDGAQWRAHLKAWVVPATPTNVASLSAVCTLPPELEALLPPAPVRERPVDTGKWLTRATPYEHQREAVAAAMQVFDAGRPGFALLMEQGCGKTLAALEIVSRLHATGRARRVLVVAPGAVVSVWARETAAFAPMQVELRELLGSRAKRLEALEQLTSTWLGDPLKRIGILPLQVAVINYESAWRIADELEKWAPDVVIADESQRIKGHNSKQTKGVTKIGAGASFRLALSGTPVTNSPLDVFAQWRYLDRRIFGDSFYAFQSTYAVMGGYQVTLPNGRKKPTQVVGYRRLDELTRKAHAIAYRVTKADALDLPETIDTVVPVTLSPAERRAYNDLVADSVAELEGGEVSVTNVLTRLLRLQQIASGSVPTDDGETVRLGTSKLDAVAELVEDAVSGGDKVVVFCRFRAEIAELLERLENAVSLTGDVPNAERGELIRRFQEDAGVRVLVAQLQVGGAGITLTAASTMVFASLSFNYADYDQAKARIHRIGQHRPCTYYHVLATGTVDELIAEALERKGNVAELVVDRGAGVFTGKRQTAAPKWLEDDELLPEERDL